MDFRRLRSDLDAVASPFIDESTVSRIARHLVVIDHDVIDAARAYARVFAAIRATGRSSRPGVADLLIAATAAANGLPLYTRNPSDFVGLDKVLKVIGLQALPGAMNVQKSAQ